VFVESKARLEVLKSYISLQPVRIVNLLIYQFCKCYFNFYLP
jgi:hypothetical protein